jgi:hypothetical protein
LPLVKTQGHDLQDGNNHNQPDPWFNENIANTPLYVLC